MEVRQEVDVREALPPSPPQLSLHVIPRLHHPVAVGAREGVHEPRTLVLLDGDGVEEHRRVHLEGGRTAHEARHKDKEGEDRGTHDDKEVGEGIKRQMGVTTGICFMRIYISHIFSPLPSGSSQIKPQRKLTTAARKTFLLTNGGPSRKHASSVKTHKKLGGHVLGNHTRRFRVRKADNVLGGTK